MRSGRSKKLLLAAAVAIVSASSACGASANNTLAVEAIELPAMPKESMQPSKTFFVPGEVMSFDISLRGVIGGTAVLAVGEPGFVDNREVIIVRSRTASAGVLAAIKEVRDEIVTQVDLESGRVLQHDADSKFGDKEAQISSSFGGGLPGSFSLKFNRKGRGETRIYQQLPKDTYAFDVHAILGVVRAWDAEDGEEENFFMLSGKRLWRSSIRVGAHETITTSMGRYPAVRIDGVAQRVSRRLTDVTNKKPRNYSIWFSDDAARLPLLVMATTEYGEVKAELVDYSRPDRRP